MPGVIVDTEFDSKRWTNKVIGIMRNEIKGGLLESVLFVETKVAEKTPVGVTGELRAGIHGKVISDIMGVVRPTGPSVTYADIREKGRKPGKFPPVDAITLWVKRVIAPENLKAVSFLVGRKIAKFGYKGAFMFRDTENDASVRFRVTRIIEKAKRRFEKKASDK
ncbi:MAG: hypothetical protein ACYSRZ_07175 [Planctomycetota bacterium]|jgi:hypothetical protein